MDVSDNMLNWNIRVYFECLEIEDGQMKRFYSLYDFDQK